MVYDIIIGRNESDKEKFGNKGLVYLGKGYVKMGNYTSLSNKIPFSKQNFNIPFASILKLFII